MALSRAAAGTADCLLSETHVARAKTHATTCSHPLSSGVPYPPLRAFQRSFEVTLQIAHIWVICNERVY